MATLPDHLPPVTRVGIRTLARWGYQPEADNSSTPGIACRHHLSGQSWRRRARPERRDPAFWGRYRAVSQLKDRRGRMPFQRTPADALK